MTLERPTGTVAFLFTDIQGSTRLVDALGTKAWLPVLARHRAILRAVKAVRPEIHIKAFTMVELDQIAKVAKRPLEVVLPELIAAGLGSVPGGGAEVFSERVRAQTYHLKMSGE